MTFCKKGQHLLEEVSGMQAHACTEEQNTSLAAECQRLLSHPSGKDGVIGGSKYNKRNTERKWSQQHYHIQEKKMSGTLASK